MCVVCVVRVVVLLSRLWIKGRGESLWEDEREGGMKGGREGRKEG